MRRPEDTRPISQISSNGTSEALLPGQSDLGFLVRHHPELVSALRRGSDYAAPRGHREAQMVGAS
jgi:hypothetical protein